MSNVVIIITQKTQIHLKNIKFGRKIMGRKFKVQY